MNNQQTSQQASSSSASQPTEYVVRVPPETDKKYHVMRFAAANNVDVTKWKSVKLDRENNLKEYKLMSTEEQPKFGAGSEFGREARDEAKRRRYGRYASRYRADDQPWILSVKQAKSAEPGSKSSRKFKGFREGGVSENTSYYVFFQAHDGAFEAFPISEWYNFTPIPRYKALTAEEAEEQFEKRDKILNYFSVMAAKKKQAADGVGDAALDDGPLKAKVKKEFKVSDMDEWNLSDLSGDDDNDDGETRVKKEKKKGKGRKKNKKDSDDDRDSEPLEESDEGDFDTREVDYMSDSSSDSDNDDVERLNRELKGVEDEDALRQLVLSESEEEEETDKNAEDKQGQNGASSSMPNVLGDINAGKVGEPEPKVKVKQERQDSDGESSSADSDDSDFDDSKFQSAMFMQKSEKAKAEAEAKNESNGGVKRKLMDPDASTSAIPGKRTKITADAGITEEAVKRYLMRKPITTTELLQKFKSKKIPINSEDLVTTVAQILKKLNPEKQTVKGKLYLYIKPS